MRAGHLGGRVAGAALLVLAAGGCGSSPSPSGSADTAARPSLATLAVLSTEVAVQPATTASFTAAHNGQGLDVGDQVRTDPHGFAEVTYVDGSWMRVDSGATLTMKDLAQRSDGDIVHTGIDTGRAWVRATKLTEPADSNELETPVGVAAVRGTVYSADCTRPNVCRFTVFDGVVEIRLATPPGGTVTLHAGEAVEITKNQPPPAATPVRLRDLTGEWPSRNLDQDDRKATSAAGSTPTTSAGTHARPGIYDVNITVTQGNQMAPAGRTSQYVWVITAACAAECPVVYGSDGGKGGVQSLALGPDGHLTGTEPGTTTHCTNQDTGERFPDVQATITDDYQVAADGRSITGTRTQPATGTTSGPCAGPPLDPVVWTVTATRRG